MVPLKRNADNNQADEILSQLPEKARRRIELIFMVQTGQLTATEAARQMGVSRKTYYKWEKRVVGAVLQAAEDTTPEQPAQSLDVEKEMLRAEGDKLRRQIVVMEKEIAKRRAEFRETLREAGIIRPRKA